MVTIHIVIWAALLKSLITDRDGVRDTEDEFSRRLLFILGTELWNSR